MYRKGIPTHRTSILLEEVLFLELQDQARRQGRSLSEHIEQLLRIALKKGPSPRPPSVPAGTIKSVPEASYVPDADVSQTRT